MLGRLLFPGGLSPLLPGSAAPGRWAPLHVPARRFPSALCALQGPSLVQIGHHSPAHLSNALQYSSGIQVASGRTRRRRDYQLCSPGLGRHLALYVVFSRSARTASVRGAECTFPLRNWFRGLSIPQAMWQRGLDPAWKSGCIGVGDYWQEPHEEYSSTIGIWPRPPMVLVLSQQQPGWRGWGTRLV
ncbi:hypothetical protein NDU88_005425 [Pleurodeles waltl]|uniref:Uncharacterized protein n=1 Tax=Pleurodeles waltl TaxID=8319 RepID=A0AAV7QKW8_PLEWA|nr:hypothetical protein NDU88_005425 [Pleurodeles waltl]